jgi:hypothetical protein
MKEISPMMSVLMARARVKADRVRADRVAEPPVAERLAPAGSYRFS